MISTYKVCRLVIPLKVPLGRLLMLLSYSDLQGNHHGDADNYDDGDDGDDDDNDIEMSFYCGGGIGARAL